MTHGHAADGEMKKLLLALVLFWPVAALADFQAGLEAAQRGDYATTLLEWRPLAELGVAHAQYNLGYMYDNGQGAPADDAEALKWFRLAAEQGVAQAQFYLGLVYATGKGVPADEIPKESINLLIEKRPDLIDELARTMSERRAADELFADHNPDSSGRMSLQDIAERFGNRIRSFFGG